MGAFTRRLIRCTLLTLRHTGTTAQWTDLIHPIKSLIVFNLCFEWRFKMKGRGQLHLLHSLIDRTFLRRLRLHNLIWRFNCYRLRRRFIFGTIRIALILHTKALLLSCHERFLTLTAHFTFHASAVGSVLVLLRDYIVWGLRFLNSQFQSEGILLL